jgi:heptosyltransferase-3
MVAGVAAIAAPPRLVDASGRLDFGQLAGLLARAALYIGPDTSVTHLAASTGVAVIALFGPTVPTRWGPIAGDGSAPPFVRIDTSLLQRRGAIVLLQGPGTCVPCGRAGCDDHRESVSECLEAITPERVIAQARALLAERRARAVATAGEVLSRAPATGA